MDGVPGLEREETLGVPAASWGQMVVVYTRVAQERAKAGNLGHLQEGITGTADGF